MGKTLHQDLIMFKNKKDLIGKTIRVIIWGRNEYDGSIQCNATSFDNLNDHAGFWFEDGKIHYILIHPCPSWRALKKMTHHYVFDVDGICVSHQPKVWLDKDKTRKGLPYAEIKIS